MYRKPVVHLSCWTAVAFGIAIVAVLAHDATQSSHSIPRVSIRMTGKTTLDEELGNSVRFHITKVGRSVSKSAAFPVIVSVTSKDDAQLGADYGVSADLESIELGQDVNSLTFELTVLDVNKPKKTVDVVFPETDQYRILGGQASYAVDLVDGGIGRDEQDDDIDPSMFAIKITQTGADYLVEGDSGLYIMLSVTPATMVRPDKEIAIDVQVVDYEATPGVDFDVDPEDLKLVLSPDASSAQIKFSARDEDGQPEIEGTERFTVRFEETADYRIEGKREFPIEIRDDDYPKLVFAENLTPLQITEGQGALTRLKWFPVGKESHEAILRLEGEVERIAAYDAKLGRPLQSNAGGPRLKEYRISGAGPHAVELIHEFTPELEGQRCFEVGLAVKPGRLETVASTTFTVNVTDAAPGGDVLLLVPLTKQLVTSQLSLLRDRLTVVRPQIDEAVLVGDAVCMVGLNSGRPDDPTSRLWKPWQSTKSQSPQNSLPSFAQKLPFFDAQDRRPAPPRDVLVSMMTQAGFILEQLPAEPKRIVVVWSHGREFDRGESEGYYSPSDFREHLNRCDSAKWHCLWVGATDGQIQSLMKRGPEAKEFLGLFGKRLMKTNLVEDAFDKELLPLLQTGE